MAAPTAGSWQPLSEIGLEQPIASTSTTKKYEIGHIVRCRDTGSNGYGEAEFRYAGGLNSTAIGDLVVFDGDITKRAVARDVGPVGVAMSACLTGSYGWYQVTGNAVVAAGTLSADLTPYLTATPGTVDETVVAGDYVLGAKCATAADTGFAVVLLNHPKVADTDDSA